MPSFAHQIAISRIRDKPPLLSGLASAASHTPPPAHGDPVDTTVSLANPAELRPDLVLADGTQGPWNVIEVQRKIDPTKEQSWPLLSSILHAQRKAMGDLWVITTARSVARWAEEGFYARGPRGTELKLTPRVILLTPNNAKDMLDETCPELAFFAAWAVHRRHGPLARRIVERALEITELLPKAEREKQFQDILSVIHPKLGLFLKEKLMQKESKRELIAPWVRQWKRELQEEGLKKGLEKGLKKGLKEGLAKGALEAKRAALYTVLRARGLRIPREDRLRISSCTRHATLDRWLEKAATVASVRELFGRRSGTIAHRPHSAPPPMICSPA